jgi:hypothetical protein
MKKSELVAIFTLIFFQEKENVMALDDFIQITICKKRNQRKTTHLQCM